MWLNFPVVLIIERVDKGQIKIDGSIEPLKMAFQQGLAALLLKARSRQWTIHPIKSRLLVSLVKANRRVDCLTMKISDGSGILHQPSLPR